MRSPLKEKVCHWWPLPLSLRAPSADGSPCSYYLLVHAPYYLFPTFVHSCIKLTSSQLHAMCSCLPTTHMLTTPGQPAASYCFRVFSVSSSFGPPTARRRQCCYCKRRQSWRCCSFRQCLLYCRVYFVPSSSLVTRHPCIVCINCSCSCTTRTSMYCSVVIRNKSTKKCVHSTLSSAI